MARSFFGRTDADLHTGSKAFARQISAAPESFGLSPSEAEAYQSLNDIYAERYRVANDPGTRTRGTVVAKNGARAQLRAMASTLARRINGMPGITGEQKIGLGLSVPGAPAAVGELGKPWDFSVTLDGIGGLSLKWKCVNPRATGTVYQISRRIEPPLGTGQFTFLGISGKRKFNDRTVPAGASQIVYEIQAVRSTAFGPVATFNVTFGVTGGRQFPTSMEKATARIAA